MKNIYFVLCLIFTLAAFPFHTSQAQVEVPDSKGKEFWLMFNRNNDNVDVKLELYITGEKETSGYVKLPDNSIINFQVLPNKTTSVKIPDTFIASEQDGVEKKGINIIVEEEVAVFGLNQKSSSTDAFLGLPVDVLGEEYIVMANNSYAPNSSSSPVFGVVATMDNTEITILPTTTTQNRQSGIPYQVLLQKGESYQLTADAYFSDLTGTSVTSNNPVAVFSGHTCGNVPLFTNGCDQMIEQVLPVSTLGKTFITVPLATREEGDVFRVLATKDGTLVKVVGNNGFSEEFSLGKGAYEILNIPSNVYTKIESNYSVMVAQLSKGQTSDDVSSDPFLMLVPPVEQYQHEYWVSTPQTGFENHFINLAVPISQKGKVRIDGSLIGSSIFVDIPNSNFAGAQIQVTEGSHHIVADLPIAVFIYGFDSYNAYGNLGGQGMGDIAEIQNLQLIMNEEEQQGATYCVKALVTDEEESPLFGVKVDFEVQGPNKQNGFSITNEEGFAHFCIEASTKGTDELIASIGSSIVDTVTVDSNKPVPSSITFLDYVVNGLVGEEICLNATVLDQFGIPIANEEVSFDVNGTFYNKIISDENGEITFCQLPNQEGDLEVNAYIDENKATEATISVVSVLENLTIEKFLLVDASTNSIIGEIRENDKIAYATIKDKKLSIIVITNPEKVSSVKLELESLTQCSSCTKSFHEITENVEPFALFGDIKGNYLGYNFFPGNYKLTATPFEFRGQTGNQGVRSTISFEIFYEASIDSFTLVNATDNDDIIKITDGATIDLSTYKGKKFNIRANVPNKQTQGGVGMSIDGPVTHSQFEKVEPLALFTDVGGDYTEKDLPEGAYTLSAIAYPFQSSSTRGIGGKVYTVEFKVIHNSKVDKLILVNADTDVDIMPLVEGSNIDLNLYKDVKLNIRAEGKGVQLAAMAFQLSGEKNYNWTERKAPYAIFGDSPGLDYNGKYLKEGTYNLKVTPYNSNNAKGEPLTVNFSVGYSDGNNLRVSNGSLNQEEEIIVESDAQDGVEVEELMVYPQPSKNYVHIIYPSHISEDAMVMIYKGNGQLIHGSKKGNTSGFNFEHFGSGLYLIHVNNGKRVISKKVFIH
ncbi:T9SS type A sorting domain-containing protein [Cyclobacterium sp. 1_MG-2023]|uniref:T9SS type A sorting domain-containing protein n=1 Tax=Cyclobacterium sp. 1_MG-2023 TaxID=3062681 RepID=UPI0026E13EAF|nr:T9SS type A sorting domain-containing protein [Cyclobacterium sp. 1_MG-2023]MDO6436166.1 T9SS type A sorting domain-containing protein [Cyclobacterium sp. 1_MG-2023]